jgi:hypothetical protein
LALVQIGQGEQFEGENVPNADLFRPVKTAYVICHDPIDFFGHAAPVALNPDSIWAIGKVAFDATLSVARTGSSRFSISPV